MLIQRWTLPPHLQTHFPFLTQINLQRNHQLEEEVQKNMCVTTVVLWSQESLIWQAICGKFTGKDSPYFVKGHLVLGKVSVPQLPLKNMWKASIKKSGPTNAKIATMVPELRLTMLNTVFPNMVPRWWTVRPRSLWITLAKKCKKICKGPASLQKHTQRDKCMLQKKFSAHST